MGKVASLRDTFRGKALILAHDYCKNRYGKTLAATYRQSKRMGRAAIKWGISVASGASEANQKSREEADAELRDIYESM